MCKIIGPGFVQYLPVVMGPLIQAASLKPEIAFVDCKLSLDQNLEILDPVKTPAVINRHRTYYQGVGSTLW